MTETGTRYKRQDANGFAPRCLVFLYLVSCLLSLPAHAADTPPVPSAASWVLMDYDSGQALAEHEADAARAPASLAKLMTAYVLFARLKAGEIKLTDDVRISDAAAHAKGPRLFLRAGEAVPAELLLQGMIVHSANDAAVALAEHAAGSEAAFVAEMNAAARRLDLTHSRFVNATGHDADGQHASARDLARVAIALMRDFPSQYRRFSARTIDVGGLRHYNRNALLWRDATVDGLKTGQTRAAGLCLAASARRGTMRLVAVILGAADENARFGGGRALFTWGFANFETRLAVSAGTPVTKARVWFGEQTQVELGPARDVYVTIPRGTAAHLVTRPDAIARLTAPVPVGRPAGRLAILLDQRRVKETPLVALQPVPLGNVLQRTLDRLQWWAH
jgi:D-alanyl-D-alanine carboxypeptidase (penicillin-binding protein 5/6)